MFVIVLQSKTTKIIQLTVMNEYIKKMSYSKLMTMYDFPTN